MLAVLEGSTDFGPNGVMVLKSPTEVDPDGMVVLCCRTTEKPSSSVPTLAVLEGLTEIGCDVVGMTDVNSEAFLSSLDTVAIPRQPELLNIFR
jgi:hypothetical protein